MADSVPTTVVHSYPARGGSILVARRGRALTFLRAQGDAPDVEVVGAALARGSVPHGDGYVATLTAWYGIPRGHRDEPRALVGRDGRRVLVTGAGRRVVALYPSGAAAESAWRSLIFLVTSVILDASNAASASDVAEFFPTRLTKSARKVSVADWNRALNQRRKSRRSRK